MLTCYYCPTKLGWVVNLTAGIRHCGELIRFIRYNEQVGGGQAQITGRQIVRNGSFALIT